MHVHLDSPIWVRLVRRGVGSGVKHTQPGSAGLLFRFSIPVLVAHSLPVGFPCSLRQLISTDPTPIEDIVGPALHQPWGSEEPGSRRAPVHQEGGIVRTFSEHQQQTASCVCSCLHALSKAAYVFQRPCSWHHPSVGSERRPRDNTQKKKAPTCFIQQSR